MGFFSSLFGGGGGSNTSSTSTTSSKTDDRDIALTDQAKLTQYFASATSADGVSIESLDGDVALAAIAGILDATSGTMEALQANSKQAFALVDKQAREGTERIAQSSINGVVIMVVVAAIAYAVVNKKKGK